ncbi:hypothetical protein ONS95_008522 [Cadophora gregata]|uniref:uncharacterized protein n=1 Tax=Cadophora gregata TaxID=51156 RepID=UPI0026DAF577|nr:uncharacterized protein ONS95_008522 [Cadophora gregata]KAK0100184.1 hypothetical protein ONS95_008522 [Cadophora gregata]KAK0114869.1 hypothetical protein ONS96_013349 [Cadophora gregata f. sp. sojae]
MVFWFFNSKTRKVNRLQKEKEQLMENDQEEAWKIDEAYIDWKNASQKLTADQSSGYRLLEEDAYERYKCLLLARDKKCLRLKRIEMDIMALRKWA